MIAGRRLAGLITVALLTAACAESAPDGPASPVGAVFLADPAVMPPISTDDVVIVTPSLDVLAVSPTGAVERRLGQLSLASTAEVDAIDVSPDGGHVLVSVLNASSDTRTCSAKVFAVAADGTVRKVLTGADATFSPDGTRIAYLKYELRRGFCMRTRLVVRTMATGEESSYPLGAGPHLEGTPPGWPVNWSPDGTKVTYVGAAGTSVATLVGTWSDDPLRPDGHSGLAPVFLSNSGIGAMTGCCTGDGQLRRFPIGGTGSAALFTVQSPIRSIRRDRGGDGIWFTTEPAPYSLWHWDGSTLRHLTRKAFVTSG